MVKLKEKHFSDESYIEIIETVLSCGYRFVRLTDNPESLSGKRILLRHDVDVSPMGALKLGEIEAKIGVVSNFFFQLNAEPYQMLSNQCIDICKELQSMGHLVGLHVDRALFPEEEPKIRTTLDWISSTLYPIDNAVSFHRPAPDSLGKKYNSFVSAYSSDWFDVDSYVSDSRGEDMFYEKIERLLNDNKEFFQLLLHPCWWEKEIDKAVIYNRIVKRKVSDLNDYLVFNFPKVFKHIIELGD